MSLEALRRSRRRTVRMEGNPLDQSTVVSIFPRAFTEVKHTIQPQTYIIPAGSYDNPSVVTVGGASWWRDIDPDQPLLEVPVSSVQVADSIVRDFCSGLLGCDMSERVPGIFFIPGVMTVEKLKKDHKALLDNAKRKQRNWFEALVKIADSLWARTNGNPLSIPDDARLAAKELGMETKPWIKDFQHMALVACVACGNMRNPLFPICPHCKAIVDADKAKTLGLSFAQ